MRLGRNKYAPALTVTNRGNTCVRSAPAPTPRARLDARSSCGLRFFRPWTARQRIHVVVQSAKPRVVGPRLLHELELTFKLALTQKKCTPRRGHRPASRSSVSRASIDAPMKRRDRIEGGRRRAAGSTDGHRSRRAIAARIRRARRAGWCGGHAPRPGIAARQDHLNKKCRRSDRWGASRSGANARGAPEGQRPHTSMRAR